MALFPKKNSLLPPRVGTRDENTEALFFYTLTFTFCEKRRLVYSSFLRSKRAAIHSLKDRISKLYTHCTANFCFAPPRHREIR